MSDKEVEIIAHNGRYRVVVTRPNSLGGRTIQEVVGVFPNKNRADDAVRNYGKKEKDE